MVDVQSLMKGFRDHQRKGKERKERGEEKGKEKMSNLQK
jgi:hypothetical protein